MPIYERGPVRIHYEEMGSGFPLLVIPGGGLNSTIGGLDTSHPFNAMKEFAKDGFRCIGADLRNANDGQSSGPLEIDRPWDAYTDDHIGLMDHLGIGPRCRTSSTRTTSATGAQPWSHADLTSRSSR
jgi:pimeloyl-ACP methyl ester carboxylesterase